MKTISVLLFLVLCGCSNPSGFDHSTAAPQVTKWRAVNRTARHQVLIFRNNEIDSLFDNCGQRHSAYDIRWMPTPVNYSATPNRFFAMCSVIDSNYYHFIGAEKTFSKNLSADTVALTDVEAEGGFDFYVK